MADPHNPIADSTVLGPPNPTQTGTSLTLPPGEGARFPSSGWFDVLVCPPTERPSWAAGTAAGGNFEICRATRSTDTLTLVRAQYGTNARAIGYGDRVYQPVMPHDLNGGGAGGGPVDPSDIVGFPSDATKYLDGSGLWTTPTSGLTAPVRLDDPQFGASHDSAYDNAPAFAAAFTAATRGQTLGGTVVVPVGRWYIKSPVYIPPDCMLVGETPNSSCIIQAGTGFVGGALVITGSGGSLVKSFTVDATGTFNCPGHTYIDNTQVRLLTVTAGIGVTQMAPLYYIRNSNTGAGTFQLSTSSGGGAIVTSAGSGTVRARVAGGHQVIRDLFLEGFNIADNCLAFLDCGTLSEIQTVFAQRGTRRILVAAGSGEWVCRNCTFANPYNTYSGSGTPGYGEVVYLESGAGWWFGGCVEGPVSGSPAITVHGLANHMHFFGVHLEGPRGGTNSPAGILLDGVRVFAVTGIDCGYAGAAQVFDAVVKIQDTGSFGTKGFVEGVLSSQPTALVNDVVNNVTVGGFAVGSNRYMGRYDVPVPIPSVTAAATITLSTDTNSNVFTITGNTGISSITASYAGRQVTLIFTGTPTLTNSASLKLAGAVNFVATANDTLTLVSDGTNWIEVARSVN